jgi:large subunit ribosomal protein L9
MKVILNEDLLNLGEEGDIKDVANGYARNYLFPKNLAVPHTKQNFQILERTKSAIEARKDVKRKEALGLKEKLDTEELTFRMTAAESGKLFGSVTSSLITEELVKRGYDIERKRIDVPGDHIRSIGEYQIRIRLYGQEEASIKVTVEQENVVT